MFLVFTSDLILVDGIFILLAITGVLKYFLVTCVCVSVLLSRSVLNDLLVVCGIFKIAHLEILSCLGHCDHCIVLF